MTINFFFTAALLSLMSCGASQKSVSLDVTTAFNVSSEGYTGGLIAYGENTKGDRFSVSANTGKNLSIKIEDGTWKIFVMGWVEGNNMKFRGTKYCGSTTVNLGAATSNIDITVNTANCSSAEFQSEANVQNLLISSCAGFYDYDSAADTYAPLTAASPVTFCNSLPASLSHSHPYYKLISTEIKEKVFSLGMSSECLSTDASTGIRLGVPTKKFPWTIKMYRSLKDCQTSATVGHASFELPFGITQGNQASFDQHFMTTATSDAQLALPSSSTRRGYSPFMNLQPRILCNSSDCFASPQSPSMDTFSGEIVNFDIPWEQWSHDNRSPVLIKGFKTSNIEQACDASTLAFLNSSPYFSASNCQIDRGNLKAKFDRNVFTCRGGSDVTDLYDVYEKNGKIYVVTKYYNGGFPNYKIKTFSKNGVRLQEVGVPYEAGQSFKAFTVDTQGTIFVLMSATAPTRTLYRFPFDYSIQQYSGFSQYNSNTNTFLANFNKIEAVGNNSLVGASATDIQSFSINNANVMSGPGIMTPIPSATDIRKLLFKDNKLYVLNSAAGDGKLHRVTVSNSLGLTVENSGVAIANLGAVPVSIDISTVGDNKYLLTIPAGFEDVVKVFPFDGTTVGSMSASYQLENYAFGGVMVGGNVYVLDGSSVGYAKLMARTFTPGNNLLASAHSPTADMCEAKLVTTIDSVNYKLNLSTKISNPVKSIFDESFRKIGRRTLATPDIRTYFDSLRSDGDDDYGRSEGLLGRASEMMGPDGLGGILNNLYPGKSCAQLRNSAGSTGLTNNFTLNDGMNNESRSFALSITAPTTAMHDLACNTAGCLTPYDLAIMISSPGIEKLRLQFSCTQKLGSIESVDLKDGEVTHELTIWNTGDETSARYENYEIQDRIENGTNKKRINISTLKKTAASGLVQRYVEINRTPALIEGNVSEVAINGEQLMSSSLHVNNLPLIDFNSSNTNTIGSQQIGLMILSDELFDLTNKASSCTTTTNTSPVASNNPDCYLIQHGYNETSLTSGLSFNLESLKAFTDGTGTSAQFYSIFTLQP